MDKIQEIVGDLFEGEIEIAGKKIPKIVLVLLGGGAIVLLVLMGKGGKGGSISSPTAFSAPAGNEESAESQQEQAATNAGMFGDLQQELAGMLTQNTADLTGLIQESTAATNAYVDEQISTLYGGLADAGATYAEPIYSYPTPGEVYPDFPTDNYQVPFFDSGSYAQAYQPPMASEPQPVQKSILPKPGGLAGVQTKTVSSLSGALDFIKKGGSQTSKPINTALGGVTKPNIAAAVSGAFGAGSKKNVTAPVKSSVAAVGKPNIANALKNLFGGGSGKPNVAKPVITAPKPVFSFPKPSSPKPSGNSAKPVFSAPKPAPYPTFNPGAFVSAFKGYKTVMQPAKPKVTQVKKGK